MNPKFKIALYLVLLVAVCVALTPAKQGTYTGIDAVCCPNPTAGDHYWGINAELVIPAGQTLGLSLLEDQISSTGTNNGGVIINGKALVVTRAAWIADVGPAPNVTRYVQGTATTRILFFGPELVARFYADEDGGVAIDGDATIGLANQSTVQVSGRLSLSGYWIKQ